MGTIVGIFIAPEARVSMQPVTTAAAVPERGLEGDRYYHGIGSFSRWPGPHREVTLIAEEDLQVMHRETGVALDPAATRRNLVTRGTELAALIGREFVVGDVRMRGMQRCQPCGYLARLTGAPDLVRAMRNRGGIRARILSPGIIRVGDAVEAAPSPSR